MTSQQKKIESAHKSRKELKKREDEYDFEIIDYAPCHFDIESVYQGPLLSENHNKQIKAMSVSIISNMLLQCTPNAFLKFRQSNDPKKNHISFKGSVREEGGRLLETDMIRK